tara:strand:+ start:224 stop:970 length:747 start_codon:yes stop_codon:yes gene_type:complete
MPLSVLSEEELWTILRRLPLPELFAAREVCKGWRHLLDVTASGEWWLDALHGALGLPVGIHLGSEHLMPGVDAAASRAVVEQLHRFRRLTSIDIDVSSKSAPGPTAPEVWRLLDGWEQLVLTVALRVRVPCWRWLHIEQRALAYFVMYVGLVWKDVVERDAVADWWDKVSSRLVKELGHSGESMEQHLREHIAESFRLFLKTMCLLVLHPLKKSHGPRVVESGTRACHDLTERLGLPRFDPPFVVDRE